MGFRLSTGLGPVRFNAPIPWMVVAVVGLCCCGAGVIGNLDDDDQKPQSQVTEAPQFVTTTAPSPTPSRSQKAVVKSSPTPKRTTAKPKPSTVKTTAPTRPKTTAPTTDKRYGTCKDAISRGLGPYVKGEDPEYYWYRDTDSDGVVCERS